MSVQSIIQHLNTKPSYGVSIRNVATGLRLKKDNVSRNKYIYTKQDILKESPSVEDWIKLLHSKGFSPTVYIDLMQPNGTSNISKHTITLDFVGRQDTLQTQEENQMNNSEHKDLLDRKTYPTEPYYANNSQMGLGMVAMPAMEVINLKRKEDKVEDLLELKEQLKSRIKDLESKNRRLEEDKSTLRADLKVADAQKEIEVKLKEIEKKSIWESPAVAKGIESLAGALPVLLAKGQQPIPAMASPELSEIKTQFIEAMTDDRVTDQMIILLHHTLKGLVQHEGFTQNLNLLLQQQNIINNG